MIKRFLGNSLTQFYRIKPKFIRFLMVGALNTLFSLTVYWILVFLGVHYSIAVFVSNMLGILFNYKTTGKLVFESKSNKLILKFIAVYLLVYLLSLASLNLLFDLGIDKYSGAVIIALPMAVVSFYLMKKYVFNTKEIVNKEMKTESSEYKEHLENKYLPGRALYLRFTFYPKILKQFDNNQIIDLGCGTGEFLLYARMKGRAISGIDNNPFLVEKSTKLGFNVEIDNVTALDTVKNKIYNAVCDNVLEHLELEEIDMFFLTISEKLHNEGTLVVIVPDRKGFKHDPTHKTFLNKSIIKNYCQKYSLKLSKVFYHPINLGFVGSFFYLNMQVFVIKK